MARRITCWESIEPAASNRSISALMDGIRPAAFAFSRIPRVPMTGMPKTPAHVRAARSSKTQTALARFIPMEITAVSPFPRSHARISTAADTSGVTTIPAGADEIHRFAGSSQGPARISSATEEGTNTRSASSGSNASLSILPRRISGEALMIHSFTVRSPVQDHDACIGWPELGKLLTGR